MLQDQKILITGVAGSVARPIAEYLAKNNDVWGLARFSNSEDRSSIEARGIKTLSVDIGSGDFANVPTDFTHVLHFAFARPPAGPEQFEQAFRINGEGTGFLLQHCRKAKAALVISSASIYSPNDDPFHLYNEFDLLGRALAWSPSSPVSKVVEEAVARFCARAFNLPTTIVRLNTVYGRPTHMPSHHIRMLQAGQTIPMPYDPNPHSPIHVDDMCAQLEALLGAAGTPALVTNWAGDEVVTAQQWCTAAGEQLHLEPKFIVHEVSGTPRGNAADVTRRQSITGPCRVKFADGLSQLINTYHSP